MNQKKYQNATLVGIIITLVLFGVSLTQIKVAPVLINIMGDYQMSASAASWLLSLFNLVGVFVAIPSGLLVNRVGAKPMVLGGAVVVLLGSALAILFAGPSTLLISRAIEGMGFIAVATCGATLIERCVAPEKLGSAMGIWGTGLPLGSVVAGPCAPALYQSYGLPGTWLVFGIVLLAAALLLAFIIKEHKPEAIAKRPASEAAPVDDARYRDLFTKNAILFFLGDICINIALLAYMSYSPSVLQMKGVAPTTAGLAVSVTMAFALVGSVVFGKLADKFGCWKLLLVVSTLVIGPCCFLAFNFTGATMWTGAAIMGLVGMGSTPVLFYGLVRVLKSPKLVPLAMGVLLTSQGLGQFIGTAVFQALLGPEFGGTLIAGIVSILVCALGAFLFSRTKDMVAQNAAAQEPEMQEAAAE